MVNNKLRFVLNTKRVPPTDVRPPGDMNEIGHASHGMQKVVIVPAHPLQVRPTEILERTLLALLS